MAVPVVSFAPVTKAPLLSDAGAAFAASGARVARSERARAARVAMVMMSAFVMVGRAMHGGDDCKSRVGAFRYRCEADVVAEVVGNGSLTLLLTKSSSGRKASQSMAIRTVPKMMTVGLRSRFFMVEILDEA